MHGLCLHGVFCILTMEPRLVLLDVKTLALKHTPLSESPETWGLIAS